ncbi:hypothetical protein DAI22_02g344100 [Oryza sativa Japonica Group]|nr:hypothetical protein DAI22_02g344100 [Oryza sativa Japonica Group]
MGGSWRRRGTRRRRRWRWPRWRRQVPPGHGGGRGGQHGMAHGGAGKAAVGAHDGAADGGGGDRRGTARTGRRRRRGGDDGDGWRTRQHLQQDVAVEQDVGRLEVAVHERLRLGLVEEQQRRGYLRRDPEPLAPRDRRATACRNLFSFYFCLCPLLNFLI